MIQTLKYALDCTDIPGALIKNVPGIDWQNRPLKRLNDNKIISSVWDLLWDKDHVNVLSFPAATWQFELLLMGMFPKKTFNFFGVEKDPEINNLCKKVAAYLNKKYRGRAAFKVANHDLTWNDAIYRVSPSGENPFIPRNMVMDIVYPDFMGGVTQQKIDDIKCVYQSKNILSEKSAMVFSLSLMHRNSHEASQIIKDAKRFKLKGAVYIDDERFLCKSEERANGRAYDGSTSVEGSDVHLLAQGIFQVAKCHCERNGYDVCHKKINIYYNHKKAGEKPFLAEGSFLLLTQQTKQD